MRGTHVKLIIDYEREEITRTKEIGELLVAKWSNALFSRNCVKWLWLKHKD